MANKHNRAFTSFNAGELSPKLDARSDIGKYQNGCREMLNVTAGLYGEAERRTGLQYIASTKDSSKRSILVDWEYSTTTTFTLEVGDGYIRFFSGRAQVLSGGSPYEITSPYGEDDLYALQFAQINDVARITHPSYPPYILTRLTDISWTLAAIEFLVPPLLDENTEATTITPSAVTGAGITLTATAPIFEAGHIGSWWQCAHLRESTYEEEEITAVRTGTELPILGDWNVRSYGVWSADILIQRRIDGGLWETIRKFSGKEDRNIDAVGTQSFEADLRVVVQNYAAPAVAGATTPRVVLEAVDNYIYGLVKITGFTDTTHVTATVITDFYAALATKYWREGAWSDVRGYPRAITVYGQRIVYGGTDYRRQTVWGSVTGDYDNFKYGSGDTDAFAYTMGSKRQQTILWLVSQKALMIGTTSGEWAMSGAGEKESITPTSIFVYPQSEHGSTAVAAKLVGDVVLFLQRNSRKVRELTFSFERDKYVAPDLTTLAEHITKTGIIQIAAQQLPINILWAVTTEGRLLSMTYERGQDVVGWTAHETDGFFESVACVYGDSDDEVWCVVRREINGSTKRFVEALKPVFNPDEGDTKDDAFFVDSGLTFDAAATPIAISIIQPTPVGNTGSLYTFEVGMSTTPTLHGLVDGGVINLTGDVPYGLVGQHVVEVTSTTSFNLLKMTQEGVAGPYTSQPDGSGDYFTFTYESPTLPILSGGFMLKAVKTITGLDHLKDMEVQILADGAVHPNQVVDKTAGSIVLDDAASIVHVGLAYTSRIKPMRLDIDASAGQTQGMTKRITELNVRLLNSLGLKVGDGDTMDRVAFRKTTDPMGSSPPLFTGETEIPFDGDYDTAGDIVIEQDQPLPMTVLGIVAKYEISGQ